MASDLSSLRPRNLRSNVQQRLDERDARPGTIAVLCIAAIPLIALLYMYYLMVAVPEVSGLESTSFDQATIVYTTNGEEITRYYTANRKWVTLDSIAEPVVNALVATEDRRFYDHYGIDIVRTGGAFFRTVGGNPQGGSTLTMQLARNLYEDIGGTNVFTRKIKEYFTAVKLEDVYSKDKILELYLNMVPFGYDAYGIEAAARTYFSKSAHELTVAQAAVLVGMLKGTTLYNPQLNPDNARERRNVVLEQMEEAGYISEAERSELADQPLGLDFQRTTYSSNMAPYFAAYIRSRLEDWAQDHGYNLYTDGLRVYTTIDADIQAAATESLTGWLDELQAQTTADMRGQAVPGFVRSSERYRQLTEQQGVSEEAALERLMDDEAFVDSLRVAYTRIQGGVVAMNPDNGHVKAWVGGRNFEEDQYDHIYLAQRQPGSTFKPFVYATALSQGFSQNTLIPDTPVRYEFPRSGRVWTVENFAGESGEPVPMRVGLARSLNTVTARLMIELGAGNVADMAHRMGIESELDEVPSLGLGTSPVTLLEMVTAYSTIADNGTLHEPVYLNRIESKTGRVIQRFAEESSANAVSPPIAYGTLDMMRGVIEYGTGVRMRHAYGARGDLAGKTGTTTDGADTWFFLLHPDLVMGSWVGFKSPSVSFSSNYWGQGSHAALPVIGQIYQQIDLPTSATFDAPPGWSAPQEVDTSALRDSLADDGEGEFDFESMFDWFDGGDEPDTTGMDEGDEFENEGADTIGVDFDEPGAGDEEGDFDEDEEQPDEGEEDQEEEEVPTEDLSPADSLNRMVQEGEDPL